VDTTRDALETKLCHGLKNKNIEFEEIQDNHDWLSSVGLGLALTFILP